MTPASINSNIVWGGRAILAAVPIPRASDSVTQTGDPTWLRVSTS